METKKSLSLVIGGAMVVLYLSMLAFAAAGLQRCVDECHRFALFPILYLHLMPAGLALGAAFPVRAERAHGGLWALSIGMKLCWVWTALLGSWWLAIAVDLLAGAPGLGILIVLVALGNFGLSGVGWWLTTWPGPHFKRVP